MEKDSRKQTAIIILYSLIAIVITVIVFLGSLAIFGEDSFFQSWEHFIETFLSEDPQESF